MLKDFGTRKKNAFTNNLVGIEYYQHSPVHPKDTGEELEKLHKMEVRRQHHNKPTYTRAHKLMERGLFRHHTGYPRD